MLLLMLTQRRKSYQVETRDATFGIRTLISPRYKTFTEGLEAYKRITAMDAHQRIALFTISHHIYKLQPTKIHRQSLFSS